MSEPVKENQHHTESLARITGIATFFNQELKQKGLHIPDIKAKGVTAIIGTNEAVGQGFFEAVQARNPDGYIVGVGAGNVFTMLHCFREGSLPKGIILADLDPAAVLVGKLLIRQLKASSTVDEFNSNFFNISAFDFGTVTRSILDEESDLALQKAWREFPAEKWSKIWQELGKREPLEWKAIRSYKYEGQNIDVVGATLDRFSTLKQLAEEDNIVIVYADFTDPNFITTVRNLPDFNDSTNIIYLSNIADHITYRGTQLANIRVFENLKAYQASSKPPIFIDTLGQKLNYFLRARHTVPKFDREDFMYMAHQPRSRKPEGLLFADIT